MLDLLSILTCDNSCHIYFVGTSCLHNSTLLSVVHETLKKSLLGQQFLKIAPKQQNFNFSHTNPYIVQLLPGITKFLLPIT